LDETDYCFVAEMRGYFNKFLEACRLLEIARGHSTAVSLESGVARQALASVPGTLRFPESFGMLALV
jgi:hypothetical protein